MGADRNLSAGELRKPLPPTSSAGILLQSQSLPLQPGISVPIQVETAAVEGKRSADQRIPAPTSPASQDTDTNQCVIPRDALAEKSSRSVVEHGFGLARRSDGAMAFVGDSAHAEINGASQQLNARLPLSTPLLAHSDGRRVGGAVPTQAIDPWTAAHERVFGIKPAGCGDHASALDPTQPIAPTVQVIRPDRQALLKSREEAGEPCFSCGTRTSCKCAHCDTPICRAHGYSIEGNQPGELCGECRDAAQLEMEGIRIHGRADLGIR